MNNSETVLAAVLLIFKALPLVLMSPGVHAIRKFSSHSGCSNRFHPALNWNQLLHTRRVDAYSSCCEHFPGGAWSFK